MGWLSVVDAAVRDNVASEHADYCGRRDAGGGAGIDNAGVLVVTRSILAGNAVHGVLGRDDVGYPGGGLFNRATAPIEDSALTGSWAAAGGGIHNDGELHVSGTQVDYNHGRFFGAGLSNRGSARLVRSSVSYNGDGGILNGDWSGGGTLALENVTVSGNSAYRIAGAVLNVAGYVSLVASTVASNKSPVPPARVNGWGGSVSIRSTIVANPSRGDCGGSVSSGGYNIDTDGSCGLSSVGDLPNTNPGLRALADNGGSTLTHALRYNSPAIDQIPATECAVAADQRGAGRPQPRGGACDIGAYEYSSAVDLQLLIDDVRAAARLGTIPKAVEQALVEPLKAALLAYLTSDLDAARTGLLAFAGLVMQLESDGRLDEATAAPFLAAAKCIHAMISAEAKTA